MKGLLLKDWYVLWKQSKQILLISLLYIVLTSTGNGNFTIFAVIFLAMAPITVMGFDERSKWDQYVINMPYSRQDLVYVKYLLTVIGVLGVTFFYFLILFITSLMKNTYLNIHEISYELLPMIIIGLIFTSVNLPIIFKFGAEKGRLLFVILCGLLAACIGAAMTLPKEIIEQFLGKFSNISLLTGFILSILLFILSAQISVKIYERREF